jgi:hypothetical protein
MLATSPAWAKSGNGLGDNVGKSSLGHTGLSLETMPGYNATFCIPPENASSEEVNSTEEVSPSKTGLNTMPNKFDLLLDISENRTTLDFTISDVLGGKGKDQILILVYSSATVPTTEMPAPGSDNQLLLDTARMEILAMYNIPAQDYILQGSTRIGAANPVPRSKVSFSVNLDRSTLLNYKDKNDAMYFQAALLSAEDYEAGNFGGMILSELDTIGFADGTECPADSQVVSLDTNGTLVFDDPEKGNNITIDTLAKDKNGVTKTK